MGQMNKYTINVYSELVKEQDNLLEEELYGKEQTTIEQLTFDSKKVTVNTLFICKGMAFKEEYLKEAVKNGAVCYISEQKYELDEDVPYILVKDIRKAMPVLANKFFNEAWKELNVIGIGVQSMLYFKLRSSKWSLRLDNLVLFQVLFFC